MTLMRLIAIKYLNRLTALILMHQISALFPFYCLVWYKKGGLPLCPHGIRWIFEFQNRRNQGSVVVSQHVWCIYTKLNIYTKLSLCTQNPVLRMSNMWFESFLLLGPLIAACSYIMFRILSNSSQVCKTLPCLELARVRLSEVCIVAQFNISDLIFLFVSGQRAVLKSRWRGTEWSSLWRYEWNVIPKSL